MTLATEFTTADLAIVIVVVVLISIAGYVAMAETALTRMNKVKAMTLAEEQPRRGRALLRLVGHPERFLNPLLLVLLVCQLVQATLVGILSERLFGTLGIVIATIFNVVIVFVFAEAAPKTWALQHPERSALLVARPVSALVAFPPIRVVSKALIGLTNVILPGKGLKKGPFVSEEELLAFADVAVAGRRDRARGARAHRVDHRLRRHRRPRSHGAAARHGHACPRACRCPRRSTSRSSTGSAACRSSATTVDDVKGLAYAKDLMRAEREGRGRDPVSGIMRPAHFVPETKPVAVLMREMQAGKFHMALLVDEHGGIAGVVTLEDLLEELVGDIVDEYDTEDAEVERLDDGGFRVQGSVPIDELNDLLESDIPHDGWDTVGGFVLGDARPGARAGRVAQTPAVDLHRRGDRGSPRRRGARHRGSRLGADRRRRGVVTFRSGFVTLIGRPNVGKSTLLNRILGTKVSIVSDKPQTTRTQVRGVLTRPDAQIVFVDTPGIHKPVTALGTRLNATANDALDGVDVVCLVIDATMPLGKGDRFVAAGVPRDAVVVVNKVDIAKPARSARQQLRKAGELELSEYFPVSAETGARCRRARRASRVALARGPAALPRRRRHRRPRGVLGRGARARAAVPSRP